jgi:amidohydrolase
MNQRYFLRPNLSRSSNVFKNSAMNLSLIVQRNKSCAYGEKLRLPASTLPLLLVPVLLAFFLIFPVVPAFPQSASVEAINRKAEELAPKVIAWRRDLHEHPELGNRETRTAGIIAAHLRSLGMEVQTGVGKTGVVGILKGGLPGPVVALRADMDALPVTERTDVPFASKVKAIYNGNETGVMHACGHDGHTAILMGAAELLAGMKKELRGTVKFIFQPAEEGPPEGEEGGAALMIREGVLEHPKVDVIFGLHLNAHLESGRIAYRPEGIMAAAYDMKIVVKGKAAHGAQPWASVDPIVVAAQIVNNLQTVVSRNLNVAENGGTVTIGSIHGGNRFNIIPEQVEMYGTVRALSRKDEELMAERIREIVAHTAAAAGAEAELHLPNVTYNPVTYNDKMLPSLRKAAGTDKVSLAPPVLTGEDFAFFAKEVPGLYFWLGGMTPGTDPSKVAPHHTPDFYVDEQGFSTGVAAFVHLTLDYMNQASGKPKSDRR